MKTPRRQNWISWMRMAVSIVILELATMLLFAAIATQAAQAQTLTTLHEFDDTDGSNPYSGLVHATDGNFYGTTTEGGANSNSICTAEDSDAPGCGTVFKITPSGTLTTLYSFCAQTNCADGGGPSATLIQAANGNLYGTAFFGGTGSCVSGRHQLWLRHGLRDHTSGQADHAAQLRRDGWPNTRRRLGAVTQRQLLRCNILGRKHRLGDDF